MSRINKIIQLQANTHTSSAGAVHFGQAVECFK